ncbi:MAG: glycosyltransferase [Saprospiraceae bacterium]|nr:glycosyltransferase [Saprospiraceae bacterium]MDW8228810.1 glycosyltransferase [Saprospiraceae bacterium]
MPFESLSAALLISATVIQLAFWWGVYARLAFHRPTAQAVLSDDELPPLSVLVCARNEAENLQRHLPALLEQDYPCFEVVVADDDSSDNTLQVLATLRAEYPHLRAIRLSPKISPGKKAALSAAIVRAQHKWLIFTDADCWPASPQWLRRMAQAMQPDRRLLPEIVLGYGPLVPGPGLLNRWARFETLYTALQYGGFALRGIPYMGVGRNLAWQKHLFAQTGGFSAHADIASGDDDLFVNAAATRRNTALCFEPEAFTYSLTAPTWAAWARQKRRHLSAGIRYRSLHQTLLAASAGSHVLHYALLGVVALEGASLLALACWAVRMALAAPVFARTARHLRESDLRLWFPLLDVGMALYWAVFTPLALLRSHQQRSWR